ncbi:CHAT domain-containing protein [Nonomuraea sp. NPDC050451]|uniref:CHAT domain-containing protein n=1 Tax=Nonomuraea sp. NPDC050451 TaxID=3364364 RepID=UPI0037A0FE7C
MPAWSTARCPTTPPYSTAWSPSWADRVPAAGSRLRGAEFAYLSVCGTGQAGHRLPDEALHSGAACHLAGFADVVACLWPLSDDFAVRAAEAFYRQAAARGRPGAEALHDALHELRSAAPQHLAGLLHFGWAAESATPSRPP